MEISRKEFNLILNIIDRALINLEKKVREARI